MTPEVPEGVTVLHDSEDKQLVLAFKAGDERAYERIFVQYSPRVHSVCRRMLRQPNDAEEAVQETFLRVFRALPRFNGTYQLGAWITRIATNVCLDQLRSNGRHPADLTPFDELQLLQGEASKDYEPENVQIKRSESRRLRRVLDALPPLHKAAIVLRDFEGLSYEEVAAALGVTECQVKALIHRARQGFKRNWAASAASVFLPTSLFNKFRIPDTPLREQAAGVTHMVASSAPSFAATCTGALQQCGSVFVDKAASVVTAMVVGAAAMTVAVAPTSADDVFQPTPSTSGSTVAAAGQDDDVTENGSVASDTTAELAEKRAPLEEDPAPQPTPTPSPPAPATAPATATEPAASPSPAPAVVESPTPAQSPTSSEPTTPPEPRGHSFTFATGVGSGSCQGCGYEKQVVASGATGSRTGMSSFYEDLRGTVYGGAPFGVTLRHESRDISNHTMTFVLRTEQGTYHYTATGSWVRRTSTDWGGWTYEFSGRYQLGSRPTRSEMVPERGTYQAEVTYSHTQQKILSTAIRLTESG
ncbi:MAG: RNA polymerase sigma factor [Actinomycetota bacterium]